MSSTPQRIVWEEEATKCLIEARKQADLEFRANKRTKPIWERVAAYLNTKGHFFTYHQCHVKWKNLLRDYRLTKQHNINNEHKEMQAGPGILGLMDEFLETDGTMVNNPAMWRMDDESASEHGIVIPSNAVIGRPSGQPSASSTDSNAGANNGTTPTSGTTQTPTAPPKTVPRKRAAPSSSNVAPPAQLMCVTIHTKKKSPYKSNVIVTKEMMIDDLLRHVFPSGPPASKRFVVRTSSDKDDGTGKEFLKNQLVETSIIANGHADLWVSIEDDNVNYDDLF